MPARMVCAALLVVVAVAWIAPAEAQQYGFDAECRPLPPPGWMTMPQPPSPACLEQRAQAARAAEAERKRQQAQAEAAAASQRARDEAEALARQERLVQERAKCESATADEVREAVEQDPITTMRYVRVLDVTAPHFSNGACWSEVLTVRAELHEMITFRTFNGKSYIQVHSVVSE
jgi:multidrug efflux pump subunit AcrA (membrane-fusion protein)